MAKTPIEIKSLARAHTERAIQILAGIMDNPNSSEASRVAAARELLDRGWGKPAQAHTGEGGGPIEAKVVLSFD